MKTISIAREFSDTPLGRYLGDGEFSGERFRNEFLAPALNSPLVDKVVVEIDGVEGYGSSFLEEAFGGLVRVHGFKAADLHKRLQVALSDSDFEAYRALIWRYIDEARAK